MIIDGDYEQVTFSEEPNKEEEIKLFKGRILYARGNVEVQRLKCDENGNPHFKQTVCKKSLRWQIQTSPTSVKFIGKPNEDEQSTMLDYIVRTSAEQNYEIKIDEKSERGFGK